MCVYTYMYIYICTYVCLCIYIYIISSNYYMPPIFGTPSHEVMKSSSNTEPGFPPAQCQWLLTRLSKSGICTEITSSTALNTCPDRAGAAELKMGSIYGSM